MVVEASPVLNNGMKALDSRGGVGVAISCQALVLGRNRALGRSGRRAASSHAARIFRRMARSADAVRRQMMRLGTNEPDEAVESALVPDEPRRVPVSKR